MISVSSLQSPVRTRRKPDRGRIALQSTERCEAAAPTSVLIPIRSPVGVLRHLVAGDW